MRLTLLFDLDDTLLNTNLGAFLPAYFQALARHLSPWVKPEPMLSALGSGTQRMLTSEDPTLTLQQVFDRHFYPRLGLEKVQLQDAIEDFYDHEFPSLRALTSRRDGAQEVIEWALGEGYRVVIATDPLLPRKAVVEQVRWAGLDPLRFELISSYESFHFTKSHPAYYAELLGRLGWPDGPVLMVGNDEERDLACAEQIGLRTFQIDSVAPVAATSARARPESGTAGRGSLANLRDWLRSVDPAELEPSLQSREAILAVLLSTPAVLQGLTSSLSSDVWRREPTPDDWALTEIVGHLRDTEREVHHRQIEVLQNEPQPFVPRPDAAVWAKQRQYLNEDGPEAISDFANARLDTLRRLQNVSAAIWQRPARHAIFGPTHFQEVVGFMADHDRLHIQQAWQTLHTSL